MQFRAKFLLSSSRKCDAIQYPNDLVICCFVSIAFRGNLDDKFQMKKETQPSFDTRSTQLT